MQHRGEHNQADPLHSDGDPSFEHRALFSVPRIPTQSVPTHDTVHSPIGAPPPPAPTRPPAVIPDKARWRASHLPRTAAAIALVIGALGFARLAERFADSHAANDLVAMIIGLVVIVGLWAAVIVSTPQVVRLSGSLLTVHNTHGSETFDLADALQPVDVVGNPRTSHWAVLLHRPNSTTVVLRGKDVTAVELDPIVRHYRMAAAQRHSERDARFSR